MAIARWALVGVMAAVAAAAWVHYFEAAPRTSQIVAKYLCPMHPSVVTVMPGTCPICGMDLAPIPLDGTATGKPSAPNTSAGAQAPAGVSGLVPIDLTPERIQLIGMRTAQVTREKFSPQLHTVGVVTATEGGTALVTARFSGFVEKVLVAQTGRFVNKGQALARIYSPDLLGPQQAYLNALRWLHDMDGAESSRALELDARNRLRLAGVSNEDIDEINRTRKPLRALSVRATLSGHVGKKTAITGLRVEPGTELFEIADLSTVSVVADVHESQIELVKAGQKASVAVPAVPGQTFTERVSFLYPEVSTGNRTLKIDRPRVRMNCGNETKGKGCEAATLYLTPFYARHG
ncbi:MAG: efflux RND transporter periplasmic adaptor subunit, partial [Myxococcales bacterium]